MKKYTKLLAFTAGTVGAAALINHYIFKTAGGVPSSRFESQAYKWRHGSIRYVAVGKGEPVLMVHGISTGASLLEWEEQIALLSKSYRVYGIDLLGFGASAKPNISYSSYLYASLINDFISDVIGSPVNIAASSASAAFAVAACALKPELYNKMLLVSPIGIGTTYLPVTGARRLFRMLLDSPVLGTTIYNMLSARARLRFFLRRGAVSCTADFLNGLYRSAHAGGVGNKHPISAYLSNHLNVRLSVMADRVDVPVHICWGALNVSNPISNFRDIRSLNDDVGLTVFKSSGLLPHKDQPKKFYRLCRDFFAA